MLENNPLMQVIISLIILLLMGYVGYNIFLIELQNMFKGENDIRKEISILNGTYDFSNSEVKYNTLDKTQSNFKDIYRICNAQEIDSTDGLRNNKRKQKTRKLKISCKHRKPSQTMRKHETKHV